MLVIIFHVPLKDVFDSIVVSPILEKVERSKATDIALFIFLFFASGQFITYFKKKTIVNNDWVLVGIFFTVGYIWCRVNGTYSYTQTLNMPKVAYSDFLLLPVLGCWVLKVKQIIKPKNGPNYDGTPFLGDQPSHIDLLNREIFANKIAQRIEANVKLKEAGALAIGISGIWGSGKTTFLKLIEQAVRKENRIIIHFNPWRSTGTDKILEDFFDLLMAELKKFDAALSKNIYTYAKSLTKIDDNLATAKHVLFKDEKLYGDTIRVSCPRMGSNSRYKSVQTLF